MRSHTHKHALTHAHTSTQTRRKQAHHRYLVLKRERDAQADAQISPLTFTLNPNNSPKNPSTKKSILEKKKSETITNQRDPVWWMDLAHCQMQRRIGGRKSRLLQPFFSVIKSADLFSGFTQITSSCSQIIRERDGLQNAVSLLLHTEKALHFSPGKRNHFLPFFFLKIQK